MNFAHSDKDTFLADETEYFWLPEWFHNLLIEKPKDNSGSTI